MTTQPQGLAGLCVWWKFYFIYLIQSITSHLLYNCIHFIMFGQGHQIK